ncbi:matrix extracellular phosphoglycoprotein [Sorex fumeus]|uniref:matrix extracellular phosphoglycoprotein n=1 Tax=Sorex fumeus TaxID=62283 RepID=UPI0024AD0132|nr:matrix extracellular phosphoglycoprotein [Sorex fumeus]
MPGMGQDWETLLPTSTWHGAAVKPRLQSTFQPQGEKMKQDFMDEQREENIKDKIAAVHHFGKRKTQELTPNKSNGQERERDLSDFRATENKQGSKSQNLLESRLTTNEDYLISNEVNGHSDLKMSMNPESSAIREAHDLKESTAALIQNNGQQTIGQVILRELLGEEIKMNKPRNTLSKIPAYMNDEKAPSNHKKNYQRNFPTQNNPVRSKITYHFPPSTDYLTELSRVKNIPSDFEGSGHTDIQEKVDHLFPFSGDGQPFKDILGKEGAIISGPEDGNIQTEFINPDAKGPRYNELPEKEENGSSSTGIKAGKEADVTGVSLAESTNDIIGITNFKELPGKEGQRVDASSQNAHGGKAEFHYPQTFSNDRRKEGSRNVDEIPNYNEIPKQGKGSRTKEMKYSSKNQAISREKQELSSKSKSQDPLLPSPGTENEIVSQNGPKSEGALITHSRKSHEGQHRRNTQYKAMSQRKGSWADRKPFSNRLGSPRKPDSSESSSDSSSSSESDGD